MIRILRPGLVAIRYIGKIDISFRGAVENKKYIIVHQDDIVLVPVVDAITYCRGTQWEEVETNVDISNIMLNSSIKEDIPGFDTDKGFRTATLENLNDLNEAEIKTACKKYDIKIGRKKVEDLIPLLIPFLEQEKNQA